MVNARTYLPTYLLGRRFSYDVTVALRCGTGLDYHAVSHSAAAE